MSNEQSWVSNGTVLSFGLVPEIVNTFSPVKALRSGEIWLPVGDVTKGYIHLKKHEDRIRTTYGGIDALTYVRLVCSGFSEIYFQNKTGTLMLKKYNGVKSAVIAAHSDGIYQVITAFPITREMDHKRRREELIWRKK